MTRGALVLVALAVLAACAEKKDPLGDIARATTALVTCQNNQEFPGECDIKKAALRTAKLAALSKGHNEEAIVSAEALGNEPVTSNAHNAPMQKIRAAFDSTWVPTEPEAFVFKLFSDKFHCSDFKALIEGKELHVWVARGVEDGKLLFAFAPYSDFNLRLLFSESGVEGRDPAPCIDSNGIDEGFAIVTREKIASLERAPPKVRGMETMFRIFPGTEEASAYFSAELARHCLHVVPSVEGADVQITRDGDEVKNQSLVKAGEFLVTATKPGYLPFSAAQKVSKSTRVEAELKEATSIQPCEKAKVVVRDALGATVKGNCAWEYTPKNNFTFDHEFSVTIKNNSDDLLFAVEYLEETYDSSGVKRSSEMRFSTLNSIQDAVADGVVFMFSEWMKGIQALEFKGRAIEPGQLGRIDRKLFLSSTHIGRGETSGETRVVRYHFLQKGATIPVKKSGYRSIDFNFRRDKPECTVD